MKRFYKDVSVEEGKGGFAILLDGKPVKTPGKADLAVPTRALAEEVAEEWRGQGADIAPEKMLLTKAANTAIDRVAAKRAEIIADLVRFANADLLCYRAEAPAALTSRQAQEWDPWLDWLAKSHGARLKATAGIVAVDQPPETLARIEMVLNRHDPFALTGLHAATTILGSLVLALALLDEHLTARGAFALSTLDERYQAEKWGVDAEAIERARRLENELESAVLFMALARS
jgi:chaperone required for assembly of F1-ATPase